MKKGNYVSGTVCLCLRKRTSDEPGFLFDVYPMVEDEVRAQISAMQALDDGGEPNIPAIQASASQAPALIYLNPKIYSHFLDCMQKGQDLLESQLALASTRIMEQITRGDNS
jgi:hypothetical protein